jgi:UDP-glucose 4-epimerase
MKKYLVTGAAGFIGSAVAKRIISNGHMVYTIDNLTTGYLSNIPDGVHFIKGDVQDIACLEQLKEVQFDAIFHIAGQSSGEVSFENPVYDLQTNAQSSLLLLDFARRTGCQKFIYASTMSIYGDQDILPVKEDFTPNPKSFYAVGKLASEHYLKIYSDFGIQCIAMRLFNVYGPGQNLDNLKQGMISIFLAQAINENSIMVRGSVDRFRDFIFIDDVVEAFIKALDSKVRYQVLNIASGFKTTVAEVLRCIKSEFDSTLEIRIEEGTPGDQFGIFGDNKKAIEALDWKPQMPFIDGFKLMCQWAKTKIK